MSLDNRPFPAPTEQVAETWKSLDEYLTATRYAVRDPESGRPLEKNYLSIISGRILPGLASVAGPLAETGLMPDLAGALMNRLLIPASPMLMSFGNPHTRRPGYYSCYPLGWVEDSLKDIEDTRRRMRTIYMAGGGAGIDVSRLRHKGAPVDGGQGAASGPVGFLPDFDSVTGTTNQGGRRRGALLVQMDWCHPDIREFVRAKNFNAKLNGFIQSLPADERPAQSPHLSNMNISVNAFGGFWDDEELVRLVAENMWATGDPGLLFVDNMLRYSPLRASDEPRFSNPCGEYLASAGSACNLVTVNAARLARLSWDRLADEGADPRGPDWTRRFCASFWPELSRTAALACFLGNLILEFDEGFPLPDIREKTRELKPVGVGMSGFHTALILAYFGRACYGDEDSLDFARTTQAALTLGTLTLSADLARRTGHAYQNGEYWTEHLRELGETLSGSAVAEAAAPVLADLERQVSEAGGFFNCLTTSQAPTGSVSVFLRNVDTGIEPFFSLETVRSIRDDERGWITVALSPLELNDLFLRHPDLLERAEAQTALRLTPLRQIHMLAAFQRHNHTGVSKTINVPAETGPGEIEDLIRLSRDLRLKGFTVYRDTSLQGIVSAAGGAGGREDHSDEASGVANERESRTYTARSPSLKAHITLTNDDKKNIREVFVTAGDVGADINALFSAFGMILSTSLKCEPGLFRPLVNTLHKVRMGERIRLTTENGEVLVGNSLPHLIGEVMLVRKKNLDAGALGDRPREEGQLGSFDLCPECQSLTLRRDGSCRKCSKCGFTTC
ncbi:MAG: hypothetical protein LBP95_09385 [Deltaproteobacteria bacterium]|jgi:ribonucleoside-diphosphate reductase alpha chain|nr:hypothetical protein [Deltaproteobacteria bacterium]